MSQNTARLERRVDKLMNTCRRKLLSSSDGLASGRLRLRGFVSRDKANREKKIDRLLNVCKQKILQGMDWVDNSREVTNFTFPITPIIRTYYSHVVSLVTGILPEQAEEYFDEIENDTEVRDHVVARLSVGPWQGSSDLRFDPGRRIIWYAIARATKPEVIVESGCERGFGAVCLIRALARNGHGQYYGLDISKKAGWLISDDFTKNAEIIYGDSLESLKNFTQPIDLYICDGNHEAAYEEAEYDLIEQKLTRKAIVVSDNAHVTPALAQFSRRLGRKFIATTDEPLHWSPPATTGISWPG